MKSRLQFRGHPIHAMAVSLPIGLYTAALVADLLYLGLRDAFWFRMAFWAIVIGLVGHVGAVATGLPDLLGVKAERRQRPEAWRAATTHLVFGIALFIVQGLNAGLRNLGEFPAGGSIALPLIVNVLAMGVLGVQGWYGGELVYRHFVGVDVPQADELHPGTHKGKKH